MARDTLLGFPAHTLPYRRGKFITLSTASNARRKISFGHFSAEIQPSADRKKAAGEIINSPAAFSLVQFLKCGLGCAYMP